MSTSHRPRGFFARFRRDRDERGAYAILFSMVLVLLMALAAISVDIASQVSSKQALKDTMDAAAHAGAYALPDKQLQATAIARNMAKANDAGADVTAGLFCVIGSTGADMRPMLSQIPGTCNPGGTPPYAGMKCNEVICAIPCVPSAGNPLIKCNTIQVSDSKDVDYAFAPAIGYEKGNTGAVVSTACKGSCGTEVPNPMDVVIMADRTASMEYNDRQMMKSAIIESLKVMNKDMHYVAFGTLHKSRPASQRTRKINTYGPQTDDFIVTRTSDTSSKLNFNGHWDGTGDTNYDGYCNSEAYTKAPSSTNQAIPVWGARIGSTRNYYPDRPSPGMGGIDDNLGDWVPVPFANNYLVGDEEPVLNYSSNLVDSVSCLPQSIAGEYGTHLASALKGAVKYALANNPARDRDGTIKKVVIFETDGMPDEGGKFGNTSLTSGDLAAGAQNSTNGPRGCQNLIDVAQAAKDKGVLIITIGFGDAATERCVKGSTSSGRYVRDVLAEAASDAPLGGPSTANNCRGSNIEVENSDGDYFFCATDGSDLANIFTTALTSVGGSIKLLKLPR